MSLLLTAPAISTQAVFGGLMRTTAITKRFAGLVVDGAVRDTIEFAEGGFPCFARGVNHRGPSKDGPGEINIPISCAGMVVHPGDLMLGDLDGVICIPAADVANSSSACSRACGARSQDEGIYPGRGN